MKTIILTGAVTVVLLFTAICGAADVPRDIRLSADTDSITVTWTGDSDADSYNVYWAEEGEDFGDNQASVSDTTAVIDEDTGERTLTATIRNLDEDTTYEVAVSSVEDGDESVLSNSEQITTEAGALPSTPTDFRVTDISPIPESENLWSTTLAWNVSESPDSFLIEFRSDFFETVSETFSGNTTSATVRGLAGSTRYFVTIAAVDAQGDTSEPTEELIVDIPVDTFPPNTPAGISAALSGLRDVTVTLQNGNENMVDFSGRIIRYYQESNPDEVLTEDIGRETSNTFLNFEENTTWFFSAVAYDNEGNQSEPTREVPVLIEDTESFLDGESDRFDGGCFIGSAWDRPDYDVSENKNKAGVSGGYYLPAESDFEDFYGNDTYLVTLFYERGLGKYLSVDLKAGYLEKSGDLTTVSGASTSVSTSLTLVPVAASVNLNFPLTPYIWGFIGIGPDYWFVEEDIDSPAIDGSREWVGGYHGRAGFWFYNRDPDFKNWGAVFETNYSQIDRFGGNDKNIGGWMFLLGLFYSF